VDLHGNGVEAAQARQLFDAVDLAPQISAP